MTKNINEVIKQIESFNPDTEADKIKSAWEFTQLAHTGQKRFSGEDYAEHPYEIASILASWKLDDDAIIAGLLHDTIEDGGAEREDIVALFGEDVALLVDGVTKVGELRFKKYTEDHFTENLRKMILYMARDIRVVLIKLADRLHNMRTLVAVKSEKRGRIARETLEIYAPLAERLGMGSVKGELEDLAFRFAYTKDYEKLVLESKTYYKEAEEHIKKMKHVLLRHLAEEKIEARVHGRKKHLYSLWNKLKRDGEKVWDFDKIHDIVALRIIVDSPAHCYSALGIVHAHYKPVPNIGISDFIAQPKPNGYQSIHTKVFGPDKRIVEVQVRTEEMHEQAEYGVAAHWAYAQAKTSGASNEMLNKGVAVEKEKLSWVKQLVEWQKEFTNSKDYLSAVKFDGLNHRNFVFSPKGDVYDLPRGATPVDFAFTVHTSLGGFIGSAKVNGKLVPLDYKLKSGDVVEIIKSKKPNGPHRSWLDFVVTTVARREIEKHKRQASHG